MHNARVSATYSPYQYIAALLRGGDSDDDETDNPLMAGGGQPFMHDNDGNPLQHYWERGVMKVKLPIDGVPTAFCVGNVGQTNFGEKPIFLSSRKGQDCLDYLRSCNHWTCDKQATELYACGGCGLTRYCSEECQRQDWDHYHKEVCGEDERSAAGINVRVLDWRYAAMKRLENSGGARLRDVLAPGALFVWRGQRSEKVNYGVVDKTAQALARGIKVMIHAGHGETVKLTGPKTAEQVLDAILRATRREMFPELNEQETNTIDRDDALQACEGCPRLAFCGLKYLGLHNGEVPVYVALWSSEYCRTGGSAHFGGAIQAKCVVPEAASNRDCDVLLDQARQAVRARRGAAADETGSVLPPLVPIAPEAYGGGVIAGPRVISDDWLPTQSQARPQQSRKKKKGTKGTKKSKKPQGGRKGEGNKHTDAERADEEAQDDEPEEEADDAKVAASTADEEEAEEEENICPVCLEDLEEDSDSESTLPCSHTFHLDCIEAWGEQCRTRGWTQTCPLCREKQA